MDDQILTIVLVYDTIYQRVNAIPISGSCQWVDFIYRGGTMTCYSSQRRETLSTGRPRRCNSRLTQL